MGTAEPWILGLSAAHNGGACLLRGNEIVAAIQEERLSGVKRDRTYGARPSLATEYCLQHAGIGADEVDMIVLCVQGDAQSDDQDLSLNPQLRQVFHGVPSLRISHHLGHAISAYALSGFSDAAILVVDGVGSPARDLTVEERSSIVGSQDGWEIISTYEAWGLTVRPIAKQLVPMGDWLYQSGVGMPRFASIGGMYSAVSQQIFGDPMDAGKVMGLAPFGMPSFDADEFVNVANGLATFGDAVPKEFRHADRWPQRKQEYADLAAAVQAALEKAILALVHRLRSSSASVNFCYAGGVALNCMVNERLQHESGFRDVFVVPFAEDSGPAVGAAFHGLWQLTGAHAPGRIVTEGFGHAYTRNEVYEALRSVPHVNVSSERDVADAVADRLSRGEIGGWFEGKSELGPRALGHRSILADPRRPEVKERLNRDIKQRESFRPFAPAVMAEHVAAWFGIDETRCDTPFMLRTLAFGDGLASRVRAVSHVDDSARVQTVRRDVEPKFHDLIRRFHERTEIPMLLNTSLNGSGQPIVETPTDALWAMLELGLDFLVVEGVLVEPASDFSSILALVPVIAVDRYVVDFTFASKPTRSHPRASGVTFTTVTPWGIRHQPVAADSLDVLGAIDGLTTGHGILERLLDKVDEAGLVQILRRLRRSRVIEFRAEASAEPAESVNGRERNVGK